MPDTPDPFELDEQDVAEVFDETHLSEDQAEFTTLEEADDVFDITSALGDSRDILALDAPELDPEALDDDDLEEDEDLDDNLDDDLEDAEEDGDIDAEDVDDKDAVDQLEWDEADVETVADVDAVTDFEEDEADEFESENLADDGLEDLGYAQRKEHGEPGDRSRPSKTGPGPEDVRDTRNPHQEELLDEGVEETFPASDPVSVKRIT